MALQVWLLGGASAVRRRLNLQGLIVALLRATGTS
jgi:hypothetical protein